MSPRRFGASFDLQSDPSRCEDSFDCFHSANRICTECAFGEPIMGWGVFWRSMRFNLKKCSLAMRTAMLLHNFTIDERHGQPHNDFDSQCFQNFRINTGLESQRRQTASSGEVPRALVTDNNEPRPPRRLNDEERDRRLAGERVRNNGVLLLALFQCWVRTVKHFGACASVLQMCILCGAFARTMWVRGPGLMSHLHLFFLQFHRSQWPHTSHFSRTVQQHLKPSRKKLTVPRSVFMAFE